VPEPTSDAGTA